MMIERGILRRRAEEDEMDEEGLVFWRRGEDRFVRWETEFNRRWVPVRGSGRRRRQVDQERRATEQVSMPKTKEEEGRKARFGGHQGRRVDRDPGTVIDGEVESRTSMAAIAGGRERTMRGLTAEALMVQRRGSSDGLRPEEESSRGAPGGSDCSPLIFDEEFEIRGGESSVFLDSSNDGWRVDEMVRSEEDFVVAYVCRKEGLQEGVYVVICMGGEFE